MMNVSPKKNITLHRSCKECGARESYMFLSNEQYNIVFDYLGYEGIHAVYTPAPDNQIYTLVSDDWQAMDFQQEFPAWNLIEDEES